MKYYEYKCDCGNRMTSAFQTASKARPKKKIKCHQCGKMAKRYFGVPNISFKGEGFTRSVSNE